MIEFLKEYKEVINIFIGLTAGVVLSIVSFLLTHRFNWRNRLTKEFSVKARENLTEKTGGKTTKYSFIFEINCTSNVDLSINYTYIKLPKGVTGNTPPNPTLGELFFGNQGRFYIHTEQFPFKHFISRECIIDDKRILEAMNQKKIKNFRFIVNSNMFGDVKSNKIFVHMSWARKLIEKIRS